MLREPNFDYLYTMRVESEKLRAHGRGFARDEAGNALSSAGVGRSQAYFNPHLQPAYWGLALAAGLVLTYGFWLARERAPAAAPLMSMLTHAVEWASPRTDLAVGDLSARLVTADDKATLIVEGSLSNQGRETAQTGDVRIALVGSDRVERYVWTTHPSQTRLAAGERVKFSARLESPPAGVVDAVVSVVAAGR